MQCLSTANLSRKLHWNSGRFRTAGNFTMAFMFKHHLPAVKGQHKSHTLSV